MIRIKNWNKHQHYKGRRPPWIKLHSSTFEDYEFECLHDDSKLHLLMIWLLASRSKDYHPEGDPLLPHDEAYLTKKSGLKRKIDLKPLISSGFVIRYQSDSATLADRKQLVPLDLDLDLDTEKETPLAPHRAKNRTLRVPSISWEGTFSGITEEMAENWKAAYPAVDVAIQLRRMDEWLISNPTKRKKNYYRFIVNWLARQQERGR